MLRKYLPTRPTKGRCLLLVLFMVFIYLLDNLPVSEHIDYSIFFNVIKPLLWIALILAIWVFPRVRSKVSSRMKESVYWWAVIFAVIFVVIQVCSGLLYGFGKSPYNHSIIGILLNIFVVGTKVAGREAARNYMVSTFAKKEKLLVFLVISFFMTLLEFPISKFMKLNDIETIVKFTAQFLAPDLCHNLFATYLAFLGGIIPAVTYMGILQAFHWLSPILPNLKWIITALIGIMCPVFFLTAMQNIYLKEIRAVNKFDSNNESPISWMITCILSIGIIWFSVGVFPIYPSVIATGSMEPLIMPGDVILVEKIMKEKDIEELDKGDIIQFKMEDFLVSHRIIEIVEGEKGKSYRTKGDNNNSADTELVLPQDIKGKIVQIVPKIGWPTLLIKQRENAPLEKVEF